MFKFHSNVSLIHQGTTENTNPRGMNLNMSMNVLFLILKMKNLLRNFRGNKPPKNFSVSFLTIDLYRISCRAISRNTHTQYNIRDVKLHPSRFYWFETPIFRDDILFINFVTIVWGQFWYLSTGRLLSKWTLEEIFDFLSVLMLLELAINRHMSCYIIINNLWSQVFSFEFRRVKIGFLFSNLTFRW